MSSTERSDREVLWCRIGNAVDGASEANASMASSTCLVVQGSLETTLVTSTIDEGVALPMLTVTSV